MVCFNGVLARADKSRMILPEDWRAARIWRRVARTGGVKTRFVIAMARSGKDAASASVLAGKSASDFRMNFVFIF